MTVYKAFEAAAAKPSAPAPLAALPAPVWQPPAPAQLLPFDGRAVVMGAPLLLPWSGMGAPGELHLESSGLAGLEGGNDPPAMEDKAAAGSSGRQAAETAVFACSTGGGKAAGAGGGKAAGTGGGKAAGQQGELHPTEAKYV